ncbi:N-acetyl sugar amidotransferase [Mobilitalea sibirica]|uniref:N-acetyl sugar amidotransferase n=1 Tax=Mobilitalea sibirica TaxID=1462919 RepID=A0A8J7HCG6_9FIRM|nr:N-acetyl sugar amidotransferase [Mobilitalea sibirica]MBH1942056.1 N-acetyl sugar amidotransferase [Mobilitalea sibirica]
MNKYQICNRCIMDTTDPDIVFDQNGICNHCNQYDINVKVYGYHKDTSEDKLREIVNKIKKEERNKEYDCILGISGGVDSSYLAYLSHQLGLRILAVHVDAGWNSDIAVQNIQKICKKLNIDLHTIVIDWPTMKELQRAYMYSGLPNLDVPQDHAFLAAVYNYAKKYKLKYMLNGSNFATEGILPNSWGQAAIDYKNIKGVYNKFGRGKSIKKYPHFNIWQYFYLQQKVIRVNLLNYIDYSKREAIDTLKREFDWKYYGGKHFESRFTKFFQSYYLPQKFGYDKKRAHLSSLIVGGEMSREEAIIEMEDSSSYTLEEMLEDRDYILKKLDIPMQEWDKIMNQKVKKETDYPSNKYLIEKLIKVKRLIKSMKR